MGLGPVRADPKQTAPVVGAVADRGDDCSRRHGSDARDRYQPSAGVVVTSNFVDHCISFVDHAKGLSGILESHGFEVVSVACKNGNIPKEEIGLTDTQKIRPGTFEPLCNPVAQARVLNGRNQFSLGGAVQQGVLRLVRDQREARDSGCFRRLPAVEVGDAGVAGAAGAHGEFERGQGLLQRDVGVPGLGEPEVHVIGAQPGKARVQTGEHPVPRGVDAAPALRRRQSGFCGDDHLGARNHVAEHSAQHRLRLAEPERRKRPLHRRGTAHLGEQRQELTSRRRQRASLSRPAGQPAGA